MLSFQVAQKCRKQTAFCVPHVSARRAAKYINDDESEQYVRQLL